MLLVASNVITRISRIPLLPLAIISVCAHTILNIVFVFKFACVCVCARARLKSSVSVWKADAVSAFSTCLLFYPEHKRMGFLEKWRRFRNHAVTTFPHRSFLAASIYNAMRFGPKANLFIKTVLKINKFICARKWPFPRSSYIIWNNSQGYWIDRNTWTYWNMYEIICKCGKAKVHP